MIAAADRYQMRISGWIVGDLDAVSGSYIAAKTLHMLLISSIETVQRRREFSIDRSVAVSIRKLCSDNCSLHRDTLIKGTDYKRQPKRAASWESR